MRKTANQRPTEQRVAQVQFKPKSRCEKRGELAMPAFRVAKTRQVRRHSQVEETRKESSLRWLLFEMTSATGAKAIPKSGAKKGASLRCQLLESTRRDRYRVSPKSYVIIRTKRNECKKQKITDMKLQ